MYFIFRGDKFRTASGKTKWILTVLNSKKYSHGIPGKIFMLHSVPIKILTVSADAIIFPAVFTLTKIS